MSTPIPFKLVSPPVLCRPDSLPSYWRAQAEIGGIIYTVSRYLTEDDWRVDSETNARTGVCTERDRRSGIVDEVATFLNRIVADPVVLERGM